MKNLIVYYSYEGNTEQIAKEIQKLTNADILKLTLKKEKKTKSLYRFVWGGIQVYMKRNPELMPYNIDLSKYDNIFIGSPCWFGTYAPPISTFLNENKIQNKNIYLFVCNGGNLKNTWKNYQEVLKDNTIVSTIDLVYPIKNGIEKSKEQVRKWIDKSLKK